MNRIPCKKCGAKALPETIDRTGGYCMPCFKGPNKKSFFERIEDMSVRMGLMKDSDRVADKDFFGSAESFSSTAESGYGHSINEVLSHRGDVEDAFLVGHLEMLLTPKEDKRSLKAFTKPERNVYVLADLLRQLNSGGFGTYFYNAGHKACWLLEALDAIASVECRQIVADAIAVYGKTPSNDYDAMQDELAELTNDFADDLWGVQDDRFFDVEENVDRLIMDYAQANAGQFIF